MPIKKISLIFLAFFVFQNLYAQYTLKGKVNNESGESLPNAFLFIYESRQGVTTDANGNYIFQNLAAGNYIIEITLIGFKKKIIRLKISENQEKVVELSESISELNEVVITAVSRATESKISPIAVKSIELKSLRENSATNLVDALKYIPGVNQITTGGNISKPIIRGLGYNRVATLYDGIKQEGQQWGDEHGLEINENTVEKVELVKGAASLMYGSDGLGGLLHLHSPKAPALGKIQSQLMTNYQTNNGLLAYSLSNAGNINDFIWQGRIGQKIASNYQNKIDGKVLNSGWKEHNEQLILGTNKKWGFIHLNFNNYYNKVSIVEGDRDSVGKFIYEKPLEDGTTETTTASQNNLDSYKIGFPHQEINHIRILANSSYNLNNGKLNFDVGYQINNRKEFGDVLEPTLAELDFRLKTINYNLKYHFEEKNNWETSVGLNGMNQSNQNKGEEFIIPAYKSNDIGAFLFTQKKFDKLVLAAGVRWDMRRLNTHELYLDENEEPTPNPDSTSFLKFNSLDLKYFAFSGSIGLSYSIDKNSTLKFNFSRGFRAPNVAELSSNGEHEGTFRYEIGNRNLKPEVSHQIDLGYLVHRDHISLEITPFVNVISKYIFAQKLKGQNGLDSIINPENPTPVFKFEQSNAMLYGGEIFFDFHPHPLDWLHIANSFSFVNGSFSQFTDSTKFLPLIPPPIYNVEVRAQLKKLGRWMRESYIKFGVSHYFAQKNIFSAFDTETATDAYTLIAFGLGTNIEMNKKANFLELYLSAENLANINYQSHLSRLKYAPTNEYTGLRGVSNMGRNISFKVFLNF